MATQEEVIEALKAVIDPELFIDIWTLGLVYAVNVDGPNVDIEMTFTSVACPAGPFLVEEVRNKVRSVPGVEQVEVRIVFVPPWQPSEDLKMMLGIA